MMSSFLKAWGARIFSMASGLVCGVMALKLYGRLSADAYGVVVVALTFIGYLPLLDGGFRTTVNRALLAEPRAAERQRLLGFGQVFYSWLGVAMLGAAMLVMAGYAFTPRGYESGQPLIFFLSLGLVGALSVVSSIQAGVLVGLQGQAYFFALTGVSSWLSLVALWLVLKEGGGVWAFPASTLAAVAGVYPAALWLIKRREPKVAFVSFQTDEVFWTYFKRLRTDAWHCFQSQVSIVFLYTVDIILVGFLCSAREAAIYGVLSRMFAILRGFLQSMSEISWPYIAQRGWGNQQLNRVLNRMNAWVVGSVTGALSLTLAPFCHWFIAKKWDVPVPNYLVWLLAGRFLITSLAAPVAYVLYGAGDFRAISRNLNRELFGGVALALVLGWYFGMPGIAGSFLISTAFGTLFPIFHAYGVRTGQSPTATLLEIWSRAAAGLTISFICTKLTLSFLANGGELVAAGALGCAAGLGTCFAWSALRMRRADTTTVPPRLVLRFIKSI